MPLVRVRQEPVLSTRAAANADPQTSACVCGARVPMGVRIGLRSRSRPVFEGRWSCSAPCLENRVNAAVQAAVNRAPSRPHRHRVPLGLVLLGAGALSAESLRHARAVQESTGERIGDVLIRECGVSEQSVAEALARQWGCGVWNLAGEHPGRAAAVLPAALMKSSGVLPFRVERSGSLAVAFTHALEAQAVFAVQHVHRVPVRAGIAPLTAWRAGREQVLSADAVPDEEAECADAPALGRAVLRALRRLQPVESRLARVHNLFWLRLWLEPAALGGGPAQREDVTDFIFHLPGAPARAH